MGSGRGPSSGALVGGIALLIVVATTGLVTTSGINQTPGYATAADRVTVSVTGGAAAVRVIPRA